MLYTQPTEHRIARHWWRALLTLLLCTSRPATAVSQPARDTAQSGGAPSASEVGAKLANPLGGVWAIFTENDLLFFDGDINTGSDPVGGRVTLQPILPIPLYGTGEKQWMFITRPIVPILVSQPVPVGFDQFTDLGGLADIQLPMVVKPPLGKVMFALGPSFLFPTATRRIFGGQQWGLGPAVVLGYATKAFTGGFFPQYHWGFGGWQRPGKPDVASGSILVWFSYNLPNAWTVGTNPLITYDHTVTSGNRWNVPVGPQVGKTMMLGKLHYNFRLGAYYSVKHQDVFGQRWQVTLNVIPVIPSLVKQPILGGEHVPPVATKNGRR
jgi:hypothetical protein